MSIWVSERPHGKAAPNGKRGECVIARPKREGFVVSLAVLISVLMTVAFSAAQQSGGSTHSITEARTSAQRANLPPRVVKAERFLARRGWRRGSGFAKGVSRGIQGDAAETQAQPQSTTPAGSAWEPLGPAVVVSQKFGLVTGRISALALDPSDVSGNTLYAGSTGGGVWRSQNAGTSIPSNISFIPLTDDLSSMNQATDASISIGALSVQPGGTGVILAGTGDPNDALDSYYGAGILRSTDGGNTWSLIPGTEDGIYSFTGEGFAGFAWSTANQQRVVAAVSQAYDGVLVNAVWTGASYEGLYYSSDGGATWSLATITDGSAGVVQGPEDPFVYPDGNAATAVAWNSVRQQFIAAVRYHGYYQSADGITWTRMTNQPGTKLAASAGYCPTNAYETGSTACPIFRGALAVNPLTGDTFAWTVDIDNQDQGLWQDQCAVSAGACASQTMNFTKRWSTAALESNTPLGKVTIENGDYNLTLAAVPSVQNGVIGQDTLVLAGDNDLWKCSLAMGCQWRNTTNSTSCMSAQVGEYQHALAWDASNPLEIFVGNDSGLWRSTDAIGESGPVCSSSDATHFQNLNGSLGSLAEVESISQVGATPYTMMAGLGENGTAGVKSTSGLTAEWPEILSGEGGPVAIDPVNANNWYVNNGAGVSISLCSQAGNCTPSTFGTGPVVNNADVDGDGYTMFEPAPFLVDPVDHTKLLIGTCRLWRGAASGSSWRASDAITPILDGTGNCNCNGDALIHAMAAMALPVSAELPSGGEVVYLGMYGALNGGEPLPGHVLRVSYNAATGVWSAPQDVTAVNMVTNDTKLMNSNGLDISSIYIDAHDPTGNTVYVTVAGISTPREKVQTVYGTTDGGTYWTALMTNLPPAPANSLVVDPEDANTVYLATDAGVYSTRQIWSCANSLSACWTAFGTGLPDAPVVELSAAPGTASVHNLIAATYGRGIWMTPLWTSSESFTTATATPGSVTFASQNYGSSSSAQAVTLKNTGTIALTPTSIVASGDFSESDNCVGASVAYGTSCAIQVTFTPTAVGSRTGLLTIYTNVSGGELTVSLSGTGTSTRGISLNPSLINFGGWEVGSTSTELQVTATNSSPAAVPYTSAISGTFNVVSNACGSSVAANSSCNLMITFEPGATGAAKGSLSFTDAQGQQSVTLNGTGLAPPTDTVSPPSLTFGGTYIGQLSASQPVTLTNSGGVALTNVVVSVSGPFVLANGCNASLGANSSCVISVQYNPTAATSQGGALTIIDLLRTQSVTLGGTGLLAPSVSVSPTSLSFPGQTVGQASSPQLLKVTNTGGAALINLGFQFSGLSAASFSTGTTTCASTLAIGDSCTVQVIFTPAAAGGATASLAVSSSTVGFTAVPVPLTGTGQSTTGLNVSPPQLVFPIISPGQTSQPLPVTITNNSGSAANSLTFVATSPFGIGNTSACGTTLGAGLSCTAEVVFSPQVAGSYTGTLTVSSPSLTAVAIVPLNGVGGVPGSVQAQPSQIAFGQTGVGEVSSPVTVTITNPSGVAGLTSFTVAATSGFQVVNNTCSSTLAALASCTVGVEFAPTSAGAQSGSLIMSNSALPAGTSVTLTGMGTNFTIAATGTPSQTITSGQTANYTLLITPLGGSSGVFTFQCGTLPAYSTCTFNPGTLSISANTTGNEVVEIATGQTTAARSLSPAGWPVALPLACGVLFLVRRRRAVLLVTLLAIFACGITSCASSNGSGTKPPSSGSGVTPAGTYTIPVTATSNGVSYSVSLTLIVD